LIPLSASPLRTVAAPACIGKNLDTITYLLICRTLGELQPNRYAFLVLSLFTKNSLSLIVGSAPSAIDLADLPLDGVCKIAVNNAWRIRNDFQYSIFPSDFPAERRPGPNWPGKVVSNSSYMPAMNAAGGIIFCGATMAFAAGYWAVHRRTSRVIAFFASDMIYDGASTHFYGTGSPDPLRDDVSLCSLEAKSVRLFAWALTRGTLLVNSSKASTSRLIFPRLLLEAAKIRPSRSQLVCAWKPLLNEAASIRISEVAAPFNALREDYWLLPDTSEKTAFLEGIDRAWLAIIPLVEEGWDRFKNLVGNCP